MNIYVKDLLNIEGTSLLIGGPNTLLDNFSKDTRTLNNGDIYIGIKGNNFDGSLFYEEAFLKGAKGCILNKDVKINDIDKYKDKFIVLCDDTIKVLESLAIYKRSLYNIPVIAVTGSVGKTSTKDIIASVLSKKYHTLKTVGNYNNHIGLPLTILSLKNHECLVLEMGMNNEGEIRKLSKIAKPTVSIITNIGTAHIGNLGSRENILKAKLEILEGMDDKVLFLNNDNDLLNKYYLENKNNLKIITYGINNDSYYKATNINLNNFNSEYDIIYNNCKEHINIYVPGEHFILNSLCAYAVGNYFNIDNKLIKEGIEEFKLTAKRMDIKKINDITIINDSYNANLDSMKSALNYLGTFNNRKIAVLGDMLELGEYTEELHKQVGEIVYNNHIDILITVGHNSLYIKEGSLNKGFNINNIYSFNTNNEAFNKLKEIIKKDDIILLKASNSLNFNEIYTNLVEYLSK